MKQVEEKQKIDQEVKEKLEKEKLERHKANIEKISKQGEERKAKLAEHSKAFKEVQQVKPLHLKYQERYE